jgi:putative tryptophan/tyrosine transport system substrate-binding protein
MIPRREFLGLVGCAAAAGPIAAWAQQMRRIGVLIALSESDPESKKRLAAFRQALDRLGWTEGRNVLLDYRFAPAGTRAQEFAKELLTLQPDVILAFSTPVTATFQRETRTNPIVFLGVADAVTQGFVRSLANPEGNLTGLTMYEESVSGKYLFMLKEIEPQVTHAAFVANPKTAPYYDVYLRGSKVAASSLGIDVTFTPIENDAADVERAISGFARAVPKGSLVVVGDSTTDAHRQLIISLAAKHRLPAVYWNFLLPKAASCRTGLIGSMSLAKQHFMWIASYAAPNLPIFQFRRQLST